MHIEDEFKTYLQVIWHYKWVIAACAMITTIVALAISFLLTPIYAATAIMRVASAPGGSADYTYLSSATRLSNTYVEIATSNVSLNEVARRLGIQKKLEDFVEVEIIPETELIKIKASDPDPALARDIANSLANYMVEQSMKLYGGNAPTAREILEKQLAQAKIDLDTALLEYDRVLRLAQSSSTPQVNSTPIPNPDVEMLSRLVSLRQQIYGDLLQQYESARTNELLRTNFITVVESADLPKKPEIPNKPLNTALGFVAGFVVGIILAFLIEGMDDTLRSIEEVQALSSLPILCRIPDFEATEKINVKTLISVPAIEQLSARLILMEGDPKPSVFLLTSPEPGAGKSTISANLAVCLAQGGSKVILIDMDFHRPRQHSILGLNNKKGLQNFLLGQIPLDEAIQTTKLPSLRVITVGSSPRVTFDWLTPIHINSLLNKLRAESDFVLIDAPALLSVADPMVLASQVDRVLLVVARRITERKNMRFALQQLSELKANLAGIVVNRAPKSPLYNYYARDKTESRPKTNAKSVRSMLETRIKRSTHKE